ncbi:MAG: hypothetical protein AMS17_11065 [Spirochaetes bacterium DG_61]|nr:MAG: hypothetical protein AMS17_11065 [Spirochaetes bacterium DG_61]
MRDWYYIEQEYITDYPITLKELAKKYNIPESTMKNHASRKNWKKKRKVYMERSLKNVSKSNEIKAMIESLYRVIKYLEELT